MCTIIATGIIYNDNRNDNILLLLLLLPMYISNSHLYYYGDRLNICHANGKYKS